ncbi:hypothetical protein B0H17DRAFT_1149696 [Mycena rosella]|uniref:Uncharacterized protein n=1 Tax=Mycena rosella TaxID=1033263 RepID=A0AAD7FSW8_MYCRO|nr:hypothetical protein B0H17DRAFT_1149696 [Mycena rosella]
MAPRVYWNHVSHPNRRHTLASRNPTKDVQAARGRKKGKPLTNAQKATRAAADVARKVQVEDFNEDLDKAGKGWQVFPSSVGDQLDLIPGARFVTGETFKLPELHQMADDVLANDPPTNEEAAELIETLSLHRELKRAGLRMSNTTAAMDARSTVSDIQDKMTALFERTGTRGFALFTRGHLDDTSMPAALQSSEALAFCVEVLKKPAVDILCLFEQWSCSRGSDKVQCNNRQAMCAQTAKIMEEKLRELTRNNTVSVSYKNMDVDIRELWKCEIVGWPADIPLIAPAQIKPIERLWRIHDRWVKGDIAWVPMTAEQFKELAVDLATHREKNGGILKTRKTRKDAGKKHAAVGKGKQKKRAHVEDSDNEVPAQPSEDKVYDSEGEHECPAVSRRATRAAEAVSASLASSQSPTVTAAANASATAVLPAARTPAIAAQAVHGPTVLTSTTNGPTVLAGAANAPTVLAGASNAPTILVGTTHSPVVLADTTNASPFMPSNISTSFITYTPAAAIARPQKRKATDTEDAGEGGMPSKKMCRPPGTKTSQEREALMMQTAACKAARTTAALAAQLPPNYAA